MQVGALLAAPSLLLAASDAIQSRESEPGVRENSPWSWGKAEMRGGSNLNLDPERDLYGGILFHAGRFRRLRGYQHLSAKECIAEIAPAAEISWFGPYLPDALVLGDPAYYRRFGFRPAAAIGLTPPWKVPPEAFQALTLASPWPRGLVRYHKAFDLVAAG